MVSFGIPIDRPDGVFCDNKLLVINTSVPEYLLNKRHNVICYHGVIESLTATIIRLGWIPGEFNLDYFLNKTTMAGHVNNGTEEKIFNNKATSLNKYNFADISLSSGRDFEVDAVYFFQIKIWYISV